MWFFFNPMLFSDCLIYLFSLYTFLFLIQPLSSSLAPFSSFPPSFLSVPSYLPSPVFVNHPPAQPLLYLLPPLRSGLCLTSCLASRCNSTLTQHDQRTVSKQMYHWQKSDNTTQQAKHSIICHHWQLRKKKYKRKRRRRRQGCGLRILVWSENGRQTTYIYRAI